MTKDMYLRWRLVRSIGCFQQRGCFTRCWFMVSKSRKTTRSRHVGVMHDTAGKVSDRSVPVVSHVLFSYGFRRDALQTEGGTLSADL